MSPIRTIAVGFDGSDHSRNALVWATELAKPAGADVAVVHAVGLLEHASDPGLVAQLEEEVRSIGRKQGVDPRSLRWYPEDGDACSALIRSALPPIRADLLVVGTRGRGGHSGLLLGSTSHELAEHATIPLVVVPMGELS